MIDSSKELAARGDARSFAARLGRVTVVAVALSFAALAATALFAHAILVSSTPSLHATVMGPEVDIHLKFNVRVDVIRSRFTLVYPDTTVHALVPEKQSAPDAVSSKATGLMPGPYTIRWQVLAPDGHISRGEVPFSVGKS